MSAKTSIARLARNAVYARVAAGKMLRPIICEECNEEPPSQTDGKTGIQAHHYNGYHNRFDVKWLCLKCHYMADGGERGKLTPEDVTEIRYGPLSLADKIAKFRLNRKTIYCIIKRRTWKHVR